MDKIKCYYQLKKFAKDWKQPTLQPTMSLDSNEKFKFLLIYFKIFKIFKISLKTQNFIFEISLKFVQTFVKTQ